MVQRSNTVNRNFYYEILYINNNWSPLMRRAFGVTKKHVKSVLKNIKNGNIK